MTTPTRTNTVGTIKLPGTRHVAVLVLCAALLAGCGGGSDPGTTPPAKTSPAGAATPAGPTSTVPSVDGTWTSDVRLTDPVSDGRVVVGTTRQPREPTMAVALDAGSGRTLWTVPLGDAATVSSAPTLLLATDGPLVASFQQDTPGDGLAAATSGWIVARLDPGTGRTLWEQPTSGPAVAAGPDAVLTAVREGTQDAARGTVALDPADGRQLWASAAAPVLIDLTTAVLTAQDTGVDTVLTGADAKTGAVRWTSDDWTPGAVGSRSVALTATGGRLLAATTTDTLSDTTTVVEVRDTAAGEVVGPALPARGIPTALVDPSTRVAVVHGQDLGVVGVDLTDGTVLWRLDPARSTKAFVAGGGVVWVDGPDGIVAVDDRTGVVRGQGLPQPPALVLDGAQLIDDGPGLRSAPLPG